MQKVNARNLARSGIMGAAGFILMLLEFPLPFVPAILKLDFSELPCLIAAFAAGPFYGVLACIIKNLIHLFISSSAGVGELANMLIGSCFCFAAGMIYKHNKTKKGALIACLIGSLIGAAASLPLNLFIVYPCYTVIYGMPLEAIINMYRVFLDFCDNLFKSLLVFNLPFTLGKFIIDSAVCFLIYKRISPLLKPKKS
ncbi:MAG: ECF transporter S component [Oscillospiraceae bacterium]|nr:ECF transporter S component [Candidatus Equicaccousia limihippi]